MNDFGPGQDHRPIDVALFPSLALESNRFKEKLLFERQACLRHGALVVHIQGTPVGMGFSVAGRPRPMRRPIHRHSIDCLQSCERVGGGYRRRQSADYGQSSPPPESHEDRASVIFPPGCWWRVPRKAIDRDCLRDSVGRDGQELRADQNPGQRRGIEIANWLVLQSVEEEYPGPQRIDGSFLDKIPAGGTG